MTSFSSRIYSHLFSFKNISLALTGMKVTSLHRASFGGISLSGLANPGDWKELTSEEMKVIRQIFAKTAKSDAVKTDV